MKKKLKKKRYYYQINTTKYIKETKLLLSVSLPPMLLVGLEVTTAFNGRKSD